MSLLGGYGSAQITLPAGGYQTLEVDITPHLDGSPDGYFFAYQFGFTGDTHGGYVGLQTVTSVNGTSGKAAIFSIWNATGGSSTGQAAEFGGEGTGFSCRILYSWVANRSYKVSVTKTSSTTWVGTVKDNVTGTETLIGSLTSATDRGSLTNAPIVFHERYSGTSSGSPSAMADSAVTFAHAVGTTAADLRIGGATYVKNDYSDKVADAGGYFGTRYGLDGIFSYVGYALGTGTVTNSFETSAASGTAVTTSNANFPDNPSAVNKAGDGQVNFSSSKVAYGTRALYTGATASGSYANAEWALNGNPNQHIRVALNSSNSPSANARIVTLRNSVGVCLDLEHTTGGLLRLRDSAGTVKWTSGSAISSNTWYRIELDLFAGENGLALFRVYSGADGTALTFSAVVAGNFRAGPTAIALGSKDSTQNSFIWWDELKTDEVSQPGPKTAPTNTAPNVTWGSPVTTAYDAPVQVMVNINDTESNSGDPAWAVVEKSDAAATVSIATSQGSSYATLSADRPLKAVIAVTVADAGTLSGVTYIPVVFAKRSWQPIGS